MINNIQVEICIGNIDDALLANKYPIDRIELNSALELGGCSPSLETLRYLKEKIDKKICCMVRPRGGDFFYSEVEYQTMLKDAKNFLDAGADGIVFGFLHEDLTVDTERTTEMTRLIHSYGAEAVFHKAFDETKDLDEAAEVLIGCGIDRVLTSGAAVYPDILGGCKNIRRLFENCGDRLQLLPGGGVRVENIQDVIRTAGSGQIHMTAKKMNEGGYLCLDEEQLEAMLKEIASL
ncbi:MAG: copper homeostasis protein CutC [Erysipelotrichaceae bacterium]|nr:copper homeostasis protein CutC [Erysipelotrichaceae bacterium]